MDKDMNDNNSQKPGSERRKASTSRFVIKWILLLGAALAAVLATTTYVLEPLMPRQYLIYIQVAEVIVAGYFIIRFFSAVSYRLTLAHSPPAANSIKSLVRIAGAVVIIAFAISYLAQDPVIAASITTVSGLVIGFASSNLIGNAIAGLYLAIVRPFRIGDSIQVFGQKGKVKDISLLYTRVLLDDTHDEMLASNSSMVTTWVVLVRSEGKASNIPEGMRDT
jgi:small-conductance mechanosensitive channel